jgi:threonine/homoserine/homoserine lactone efflux protein
VLLDLVPNPLIIPVGLVVGILVAAPIGPVNVLAIHRAIERGFLGGVAAGLGAVIGDGVIAFLAALGVGAIPAAVKNYRDIIQSIGGLALAGFGLKLFVSPPRIEPPREQQQEWASFRGYLWDVPKTFFLTITNPASVLGLVAIFGGVSSFVEVRTSVDALAMVAAIMGGSFCWWVALSLLISRIRHRLQLNVIQAINMLAGVLLVGFGALLLGEIAWKVIERT